MTTRQSYWLLSAILMSAVLVAAGGKGTAEDKKGQSASKPAPLLEKYNALHKKYVERAKKGDIDIVFLGDTLTNSWERDGINVWEKTFKPLKVAIFALGKDCTQQLLWRVQHGEMDGTMKPKVVVILIGSNNVSFNTAEDIAAGIKAIVSEVSTRQPQAKVLLMGIFPRGKERGEHSEETLRANIKDVNQRIAKLDDGKNVKFLDISDKLVAKDGSLDDKIMWDHHRLTERGYRIYAEAIFPIVTEWLKK